jgi:two-component system sensor histidine kinase UhpB
LDFRPALAPAPAASNPYAARALAARSDASLATVYRTALQRWIAMTTNSRNSSRRFRRDAMGSAAATGIIASGDGGRGLPGSGESEAEARFRQLMEQAADALYLAEDSGRLLEVNREACESLGYTRAELLRLTIYHLDPNLAPSRAREFLEQVDRDGQLTVERSMRRRDGSVFPVEMRLSRITSGGTRQVLGIARDITARRQAEEALRASEHNLRSVFENLVDVFYRVDVRGIITMVTPSVERYGYSAADLVGRPVTATYFDLSERDRLMRALLEKGAVSDMDITLKRGDGRPIPVSASARMLFDDEGRPTGTDGLLRDASERQRARRQLERSRAQLRALSNRLVTVQEQERQRIARELHDELGQALTALSLDSSWLAAHLRDDGEASRKVAKISDLLDATMDSVQRITRELRPLLLDDLGLVPALEWLAREFEQRTSIRCSLEVAQDVCPDLDRATTVFRVVQEALTNVARHSGATRVRILLGGSAGRLALRIEDDGRGIRDAEIAHRDSLGLLGMRERVRRWGGTMQIEGEPGRGTRLRVNLAAARTRQRRRGEPS